MAKICTIAIVDGGLILAKLCLTKLLRPDQFWQTNLSNLASCGGLILARGTNIGSQNQLGVLVLARFSAKIGPVRSILGWTDFGMTVLQTT